MRTLRLAPFAFAALALAVACGTLTGSSETAPPADSGAAPPDAADVATDAPLGTEASASDADAGPTSPCALLLAGSKPAVPSGTYKDPLANGGTRVVYCDMVTAGGGWTLVGRSSPDGGAGAPFGWKSTSGNLSMTSSAYSLGVDFEFHEILWGQVDANGNYDSYQWGTNVFRGRLDSAALLAATDAGTGVVDLTDRHVVSGGCSDVDIQSGQSMFRYAGYSDRTDDFFFRDNTTNLTFGLTPSRFNLSANGCNVSAGLDGAQGMIFVR